jgi:hypothetical protein
MQFILAKEGEYPEIYSAMQQNFCLDEIRDYADFLSALRNVNYNVYHIVSGNEVKLLLLSYPALLTNVAATVKEIYRIVYGKE